MKRCSEDYMKTYGLLEGVLDINLRSVSTTFRDLLVGARLIHFLFYFNCDFRFTRFMASTWGRYLITKPINQTNRARHCRVMHAPVTVAKEHIPESSVKPPL